MSPRGGAGSGRSRALLAVPAGVAVLGAAWLVVRAERSAPGTGEQATIQQVMLTRIDPDADVIWNAVGTSIDAGGVHESRPQTAADWESVRRAAARLEESAQFLQQHPLRAAAPGVRSAAPGTELEPAAIDALIARDRGPYEHLAGSLAQLGRAAGQAASARDAELLLKVGGQLEAACEACHSRFWYPASPAAALTLPGLIPWPRAARWRRLFPAPEVALAGR